MKKNSQWILVSVVLLIFLNLLPFISHAQSIVGSLDPVGDVDAPFDGGITILIAAGIGYGLRKSRTENKNKSSF